MTRLPPSAVVRAVRDEFAVPGRYHLHAAPAQASFVSQLWSWIWIHFSRFLHALFSRVHVSGGALSAIGVMVVTLCVLAFLATLLSLILRLQFERTRRASAAPLAEMRSAQAYADEAARAAAAGDYARAVRALFIASVVALDVRGMLSDERGATVNELRRALASRDPRLEAPFTTIARAYTRAAYAQEPIDRAAYENAALAYGTLERSVPA